MRELKDNFTNENIQNLPVLEFVENESLPGTFHLGLPETSCCPIKSRDGNGMCMCTQEMRCDEVRDYHCLSIRLAFQYGFNLAEDRAHENLNMIHEKMDEVFKQHGWKGDEPDHAVDGLLEDWTRG